MSDAFDDAGDGRDSILAWRFVRPGEPALQWVDLFGDGRVETWVRRPTNRRAPEVGWWTGHADAELLRRAETLRDQDQRPRVEEREPIGGAWVALTPAGRVQLSQDGGAAPGDDWRRGLEALRRDIARVPQPRCVLRLTGSWWVDDTARAPMLEIEAVGDETLRVIIGEAHDPPVAFVDGASVVGFLGHQMTLEAGRRAVGYPPGDDPLELRGVLSCASVDHFDFAVTVALAT